MNKKTLSLITAGVLMTCSLSACGSKGVPEKDKNRIHIVTTAFPEYDWVMNILGDDPADIDVDLLTDNGIDLHSFSPTAEDIMNISSCDIFILNGGESDSWANDALKSATNKDMIVLDMLDILGDSVKEEEIIEGMKEEADHGDTEEHDMDEHVWLSLRNASVLTERISEAIQSADPANASLYKRNTSSYTEKLRALDREYTEAVISAKKHTLLFGDRFPFRYLTDDYGLDYYAAFAGCSAETEASFETISFLSKKADELSLDAVITLEGSDKKIAETIAKNTRSGELSILTMDSMQSVTKEDIANGKTDISVMEKDLSVLKEALK